MKGHRRNYRDHRQETRSRRLGLSEMWVSNRLRGRRTIDLAELERIAKVLDVPWSTFLTDDESVVAS